MAEHKINMDLKEDEFDLIINGKVELHIRTNEGNLTVDAYKVFEGDYEDHDYDEDFINGLGWLSADDIGWCKEQEKNNMYIYRMVYTEFDNFSDEELSLLRENNIIVDSDYGTTEILADTVCDLNIHRDTGRNGEYLDILKERVGTDVVDLMLLGKIDLVLVVHD